MSQTLQESKQPHENQNLLQADAGDTNIEQTLPDETTLVPAKTSSKLTTNTSASQPVNQQVKENASGNQLNPKLNPELSNTTTSDSQTVIQPDGKNADGKKDADGKNDGDDGIGYGSRGQHTRSGKNYGKLSNCELCNKPDNRNMVACDECNLWFHFSCVGVKSDIKDAAWMCAKCQNEIPNDDNNETLVSEVRSKSSICSQTTVRQLEREREMNLKLVEIERQLQIERDNKYLEQLRQTEQKFMTSLLEVDSKSSRGSSISEERQVVSKRTLNWVEEQSEDNHHITKDLPPLKNEQKRTNAISRTTHNKPMGEIKCDASTKVKPPTQSTPFVTQRPNPDVRKYVNVMEPWSAMPTDNEDLLQRALQVPIPHNSSDGMLTNAQMQSRLIAGSRNLPVFSGKPGEWTLFYGSFIRSTERCGYNDDENLDRLLKCLQGEARQLVKVKLTNPAMVPCIIKTLYRHYGRPDIILDELVDNVRKHPIIKADRLDLLMKFSGVVEDLCDTLENSMLEDHLNNALLLKEMVLKLPTNFQLSWSFFVEQSPNPNLSTFNRWLIKIADAAGRIPKALAASKEHVRETKTSFKRPNTAHLLGAHDTSTSKIDKSNKESDNTHTASKSNLFCTLCDNRDHKASDCSSFKLMNRNKRWEVVIERKLCRRCLGKHHTLRCRIRKECGVDGCTKLHNFLLHNPSYQQSNEESCSSTEPKPNNHHNTATSVLYRILPVVLYGNGKSIETFAFLDDGSSISLIEEKVADELNLKGPISDLCLKWTSDVTRTEPKSRSVSVEISSVSPSNKRYTMSGIRTVKNLDLPIQTVDSSLINDKLKELPISLYQSGKPTVLIGLDQLSISAPLKTYQSAPDKPIAAKTRIGWTIYGPVNNVTANHHVGYHACECGLEAVENIVKNYFTVESFGVGAAKPLQNADDIRANEILEKTTILQDNRYETGLLWRNPEIVLPHSRFMAERRLLCLENKLRKDPKLMENVREQFKNYVAKGYAEKVTQEAIQSNKRIWYLPVFAVQNPNKPGKTRLVWDAAAKVQGISLNDCLLKGPDLVPLLTDVLYKFREKPFAVSGDIAEMFHQIRITANDQDAQRFLWRDCNQDEPPSVYKMLVMTFGASCSPCSAQHVKNKNADRFAQQHSRAVTAIHKNHYVDDYLDSFGTESEAIDVVKTVRMIHKEGGFVIRNWLSNSPNVLQQLGEQVPTNFKSITMSESSSDKVLGMRWNTASDTFTYALNQHLIDQNILDGTRVPTKREVLRALMSVFDPLGLISSYLIYAKIILQEVWNTDVGWDDPIQDDQAEKWLKWTKLLPSISEIKIPRCYTTNWSESTTYELHIFVDASGGAYSAVAYVCSITGTTRGTSLVCSKTRVAPNKPLSIPRLELLAAVLGARLGNSIRQGHNIKFLRTYYWSDSNTVLSWIKSDARKYRQFVALRISEIAELTELTEWSWVSTKLNVADEATKWASVPRFVSGSRWYEGPEFLKLDSSQWPRNNDTIHTTDQFEYRLCHINVTIAPPTPTLNEFSTWNRLHKIQALVLRAAFNWLVRTKNRRNIPKRHGPLLPEEWAGAERQLIKRAQTDVYGEEAVQLDNNGNVDKTSNIYRYSPFKDVHGLIRMTGRIERLEGISDDTKNPIILPTNHIITQLLVGKYHVRYLHGNHETVINEIRQKYLIPRLRSVLQSTRRNCQVCKNRASRPNPPMMSSLPRSRLSPFRRPFSMVGIDYFGPMNVVVGRRTNKRYGVLFTCMTTRAIHLEVAHSMTTDSCILSIIRFMARRGTPIEITSDNGTNFRGADNELREILKTTPDKNSLSHRFPGIVWKFNPPSSPHFGGAWERLVRSVKSNLKEVIHEHRPNDETLITCLIEVEGIINSRPLTRVQLETTDQEALTPNHILLGSSGGHKPFFDPSSETEIYHMKRQWKTAQLIAQTFWKRWMREYLPEITRRTKWYEKIKPLESGDVVVLVDGSLPYNSWPKGIIVDVNKSPDGQVRSAVVRIGDSLYTKPAVKLAVLDVRDKRPYPGSPIGEEDVTTANRCKLETVSNPTYQPPYPNAANIKNSSFS